MARRTKPTGRSASERLFLDLATTLEFDRFFLRAAHGAAEAAGADCAGLVLRHGDKWRFHFSFGLTSAEAARLEHCPFPREAGTVGQALSSGAPLYTADYPKSPFALPEFVQLGIQSNWVIPIPVAGRIEGALVLAWRQRCQRAPSRRALSLIEILAAFIGSAYYRSTLEASLARDAHHDALTGLPNRGALAERLAHARHRALRTDRLLVVVLLDIDGFKNVNDGLGHEAGDHILASIAERLRESLRATDTVSRYGGDEFVILIEDVTHLQQLENILDRMFLSVREPIEFGNQKLTISLSAGLTIYPFDDQAGPVLLRHADSAMYEAKRDGGDQYRCFEPASTTHLALRLRKRREIESALNQGLWSVTYQPIVDWEGQPVALEGRLRWPKGDGSVLREEDIAEVTDPGLRARLFEYLLTVCIENWPTLGLKPGPLHINLYPSDLVNSQLLPRLERWCQEAGCHAANLILEVSDVALGVHPQEVKALARTLQERGFGLLIDQFRATPQARLHHLIDVPLAGVKCILPANGGDARLLHALAAGIRTLNVPLYASGVDSIGQRKLAQAIGCRYGQGHVLAPELSAAAVSHWLKTSVYSTPDR